MAAPVIVQPIPNQVINELAAYGPFPLRNYLQAPDGAECIFSASLTNGNGLPKGMICTQDGFLTGIPAKETTGVYEVNVVAENEEGQIETKFIMTIKPAPVKVDQAYIDQLKAQVWDAVNNNLPVPNLTELYNLPITPVEIYYLLERWGTLTIWDAFNFEPPGEKRPLLLEGASPHYHVYDRTGCLVVTPKDLFSHERTLRDAIITSQAAAREAFSRGWTMEFVGFDKFKRAAWLEVQYLNEVHGKRLDIINFKPTLDDVKLYSEQAMNRPGPEF